MSVSKQEKIIGLWAVFLFGTVFRTQLALIPLLYSANTAISDVQGMPVSNPWLMLGLFALPMVAIAVTAFNSSRQYRLIHFGLTVIYTVINFIYFALALTVHPIAWYQVVLMFLLLINGLLLNIVSLQWLRERSKTLKSRRRLTDKAVRNS